MVNFLLLIEKIIKYSKEIIDDGLTPEKIYELCSCIRETFFLSYSLRNENNFYLFFQKECILIKFEGKRLQYLGPDERSQALLLEKALFRAKERISNNYVSWIKSTPGIFIRKFSNYIRFIEYYGSISDGNNYLMVDDYGEYNKGLDSPILNKHLDEINENDFFILPTYKLSKENSEILNSFIQLQTINILLLSKIKSIEDKILFINFRKDKQ
ncbi:MAG: hypothetical protein ACFE91_11385 [Promethearchaeota archaeon]